MIYTFRIVSDESDDFMREVKIDADANFLDLRNVVCDSVDFERLPMSSFFVCSDGWEKGPEITLEDMGNDNPDQEVYLMEETPISDFIDDEGQRLIFVFDYFTDRSLFMELKKRTAGEHLSEAMVTKSVGVAPPQIVDFKDFEDNIDTKQTSAHAFDDDDEFGDNPTYNDDELDLDNMSSFGPGDGGDGLY